MPATAARTTKTATDRETAADLVHRLGDIPLDRIRMKPPPGTATEADLLRAGGPVCELIDGTLVEKAVGNRESFLGLYIGGRMLTHALANKLGVVLGEAGYVRVTSDQLRAPDATFIPWSAFPGGKPPKGQAYWAVAPGLVVEVLSPNNTKAEIDRKLKELFAAGCKLAWVIDPETETAKVYTSAKRFKLVDSTATLGAGKAFPGFTLSLAALLADTELPE
ncbi:MAG: Uma2 family endonuclease [Gemmataceae bacterium]|nr:Uma2 family endonuclease [Gemmataceae bacterium]